MMNKEISRSGDEFGEVIEYDDGTFTVDGEMAEFLTAYAKEHGVTLDEAFNNIIRLGLEHYNKEQ